MTVWLAVVLGGIATYLTRATPLIVSMPGAAPPALRRYLDALPIAIIAALAGAGVALPDAEPTRGAELLAGALAFAVAYWRKDLLVAMIVGVAAVALLRSAGL